MAIIGEKSTPIPVGMMRRRGASTGYVTSTRKLITALRKSRTNQEAAARATIAQI